METTDLAPGFAICRVLNGMWQVSGGHGRIDPEAAMQEMLRYHDAGFTTWDLADHYGPAEDFIGAFRRRLAEERGSDALAAVQALTKWVPQPGPVSMVDVERAIDRSLTRMGVEVIDVLQFHWWDYADESYLDALSYLDELRLRGKVRHLALTNFDTAHVRHIVELGIPIVSNQVQYSLIDMRPAVTMAPFCEEHGIKLLTYGTVGGGLLSSRYAGKPEPSRGNLDTASLRKYHQMVHAWGGWDLFQQLLEVLNVIALDKGVSIANVAVRYVLDQPAVGGVIVGTRLGVSDHLEETARAFGFSLSAEDRARIDAVLARGNDLLRLIGDCGDEYRR